MPKSKPTKSGNLRRPIQPTKTTNTRLRTRANVPNAPRAPPKTATTKSATPTTSAGMNVSRSYPSTSIGTTISLGKPIVSRTNDSARIMGRDFIGTVECNGTTTFGLGKSALLSPAYFQSTMLGNLARSFEMYRWNRLRIHYVPKVATSAAGQVVLCSSRSVSEPCLSGEAGTFLPKAMSQGNAIFAPLWTPTSIDIDCNSGFRLVDSSTTVDLDDTIHEELQVYTQAASSGQVGYLYAEYDISFEEPIFQPHSTAIPYATGPGARVSFSDNSAIAASADAFLIKDTSAVLGTPVTGTIYRAVFDLQGSAAATGGSFATGMIVETAWHATTTTFTQSATTLPFVGGLTLYLVKSSSTSAYLVYTSIEGAISGNGSAQVYYNATISVTGTYLFDVALVRVGTASLPTIQ